MPNFRKEIFVILFHFCCFLSFSQKEANIWYFGEGVGLDFNSGSPVANTNTNMYAMEGVASICDKNGDLLFYTNGDTVWNKNHLPMPNGTGLLGSYSSSQAAMIIQKPGSKTIYYIFCTDMQGQINGLTYSEVDMTLNGGLGNVTGIKNISLYQPTCEKLTAAYHSNGCDIWVITHEWNTNKYYSYKVTSSGVITTPIISSIGLTHTGNTWNARGCMKTSHKGDKIVTNTMLDGKVELLDFDQSTGIVSNPVLMNNTFSDWLFGVEFSPDDSKFYISTSNSNGLWQFDLSSGVPSTIAASGISIDPLNYYINSAIQLGPDGKIYVSHNFQDHLGVINNPNAKGTACNYKAHVIPLAGRKSLWGLPNILPGLLYYLNNNKPIIQLSDTCATFDVKLSLDDTTGIQWIQWSKGDANTYGNLEPFVKFDTSGTYTIKVIIGYACKIDTVEKKVHISSCDPNKIIATLSAKPVSCFGGSNGEVSVISSGGTQPYSFSWQPGSYTGAVVANVVAGNYTLTITDSVGNVFTDSIKVIEPSNVIITTLPDTLICLGDTITLKSLVSGGITPYIYNWNNGSSFTQNYLVSPTTNTEYVLMVSYDNNGIICKSTDTVNVNVDDCDSTLISLCDSAFFVPNAFSPNGDGVNDVYYVKGDCIKSMRLEIFDRWGEKVFYTTDLKVGWDGTHRGEILSSAIYYYSLNIKFLSGQELYKKGNIAFVR